MEERGLTQSDALVWIENALKKIKNTSTNPYSRAKVEKKLALLKDET
jgi:hypothetical protein